MISPYNIRCLLEVEEARLFYNPFLRAVSKWAKIIVAREREFSRDFKIEIHL